MCGRYALHANPDVIALQFGLGMVPDYKARYNITPSSNILIVREDPKQGRVADKYKWGLIPGWAKDASIGNKLANARGETVAEKPSFRAAFKRWRCLIPASGFYEWKTVAGKKHPYYIRPAGDELFGFAGITELWNGPEGPMHTVSLITTAPNEVMREIHDRMPVIVPMEDYTAWLDPTNVDVKELKVFLRAYPSEQMRAHPISTRVNSPGNDDEELIATALE
jgi:putative SOS response-associated peptidase YedK